MKKVPFIANHADNMHCVNAVLRMVHKYYFGKDFTWREIDKLTRYEKGKGTWTFIGEMEFAKKGLTVVNIESINYRKLYKQGPKYLKKAVGPKTAKYYIERTNIKSVIRFIPEYLIYVKHYTRQASVNEIIEYLKKGYLAATEVNYSILNNKDGFDLHFVLIFGFDGEQLIFHDPGLPPIRSRKISLKQFKKCFRYPGANAGAVFFSK